MEVIFLGTSGSIPTKRRSLPSLLIEYLNQFYLFDCGEGTQRQMRFAGINFMRIENIFITHLHGDHLLGLPGLIQSMDFLEKRGSVNIYGPPGLKEAIKHMLEIGSFKLNFLKLNVKEVKEGKVLEGDRFVISCVKTIHTENSLAYCFEEKPKRKFLKEKALALGVPEGRLFSKLQRGEAVKLPNGKIVTPDQVLSKEIPGRKVVYSGDTRPCEKVIELAKNADILIHDSTFLSKDYEESKGFLHSTAKEAAEVAKKANVKKLFLFHISQRYTKNDYLLEKEAREIFPESFLAEDLLRVKVEKHDI